MNLKNISQRNESDIRKILVFLVLKRKTINLGISHLQTYQFQLSNLKIKQKLKIMKLVDVILL